MPCIFFSVLYMFIISSPEVGIRNLSHSLSCGHLWFLPMLFWTYLIAYGIECITDKRIIKILIVLGLYVLTCIIPAPFQVGTSCYYLIFFYVGYFLSTEHIEINRKHQMIMDVILWLLYILVVITSKTYNDLLSTIPLGKLFASFLSGITGTFAFYLLADIMVENISQKQKEAIRKLSEYSFGIYLFQEFIIRIIYYSTNFPVICNPTLLPIITTVVTVVLSALLTYLFMKNKYSAKLIGA